MDGWMEKNEWIGIYSRVVFFISLSCALSSCGVLQPQTRYEPGSPMRWTCGGAPLPPGGYSAYSKSSIPTDLISDHAKERFSDLQTASKKPRALIFLYRKEGKQTVWNEWSQCFNYMFTIDTDALSSLVSSTGTQWHTPSPDPLFITMNWA